MSIPEAEVSSEVKKKFDELKSQRASTKGNMTRIKNQLAANIETISPVELECRVNIFEQYWKLWLSHQTAIEKIKPNDATHEIMRSEAEDLYCEVKVLNGRRIPHRQSVSEANATISTFSHHKSNLPQMKLPTFSGKYADYPNFIALFNKLVGDDDSLTNTEKYNHLRHCLTGSALRTIDSLGKSAENYGSALILLKQRYDNKCLIFQDHINEIIEIPKIAKNSATQLRTLLDKISSHLNAMKTIGTESNIMNSLLIHIVSIKLDPESQTKYEESLDYSSFPRWIDMQSVLSKRCQLLEIREGKQQTSGSTAPQSTYINKKKAGQSRSVLNAVPSSLCSFCQDKNHRIEKCITFSKLGVLDRFQKVKQLSLCINCLRSGHSVKQCKSSTCKVCSKQHHTLLHRYEVGQMVSDTHKANSNQQYSGYVVTSQPVDPSNNLQTNEMSTVASSSKLSLLTSCKNSAELSTNEKPEEHVVLATAVIQIKNSNGTYQLARVLLDSGSQLNFITDRLVKLLNLKRHAINAEVTGIGQKSAQVKHETFVEIKSRLNNYTFNINCWILPSITNNHPARNINTKDFNIPLNLPLADPNFFRSQKIDILIGAEKFYELMSVGQIKLIESGPILQKTLFGWIVSGRYRIPRPTSHTCLTALTKIIEKEADDIKLDVLVEKFWKIENIEINRCKLSAEQQNCETLFENSIKQAEDSRLMVKLPFKKPVERLGESFSKVKTRFLWLERRLDKNPKIKQQYSEFLQEYLMLGHMEKIQIEEIPKYHYFIPHQHVMRPESTSTKFRVVFNASCPTTTNVSLNDILSIGPTVQNDIFTILIKFRCFLYALTADVSKMYRQIWVYPEDRNFQLILWRDNLNDNLQIFRLKTLTYGTASAPYLATRCLNFLADKFVRKFPKAANMIKESVYVDDLIAGGDDVNEILQLQNEISIILQSANLLLRKWYSNESLILQKLQPEDLEKTIRINDVDIVRTLGMIWDPVKDEFRFCREQEEEFGLSPITKRTVLSDLARLFDPLGLINPVVVTAKLFMQDLWLMKLSWDESLPQSLHNNWLKFKEDLVKLNYIRIPRFVLSKTTVITEIHGFSDSSIRAFGACIYIRTVDNYQNIRVHLLTSKSRIAPSKKTRTLPVLELLGAELLAILWSKVQPHYPKTIDKIYFWTDSTIVLGWIGSHASKWQTFVGNRVSRIQEITSNITWKHVNSKSNPADIVSRGCSVSELSNSMWLNGPEFLYKTQEFWPMQRLKLTTEELPEKRKTNATVISLMATSNRSNLLNTVYRVSNFGKIRRIFAYIHRFIDNLKLKIGKQPLTTGILKTVELENGFMRIVFLIQQEHFQEDITHLKKSHTVNSTSNLKCLNPFIDESDGLLRVGGRLRNSNLPYVARCPILLPKNDIFVNSFISFLHFRHCHAGSQALMGIIQQQFWIINAREYTRKIVRKCIHCFKYRPKLLNQLMGDLPADRVNANSAFSISGVDFCGPIYTSPTTRGHRTYKTYIAVFVCFISKGVHLEVVSDLTANAFIAALKRFISRRMLCKKIYCDNATNFVGAKRHLAELRHKFLEQQTQSEIATWCAENSIDFVHIPPRSPHFGGIWEAAVKSAKSLLYPTLQNSKLTFEHLTTVCCQIEAILNSRPITQLSTDPNDERALTPSHFWCQAPLNVLVEPDLTTANMSYLSKWQRISSVQQHFWKRWSTEYISSLQKRTKWQDESPDIAIGKLVLIHEDNLPPQKWLLGRVSSTITGHDNRVRVADVKTKCGVFRRSIHKLALLPVDT